MKQQKRALGQKRFSLFAGPCKGKMTLSVLCAILSVAGGFVPFWAVYEILLLFINRTATLNNIMLWCLVGVGGYLIRVICFGISTILAHISAYTILEGIRLKNRKPPDAGAPWRSNGTKDRLLEEYYHG